MPRRVLAVFATLAVAIRAVPMPFVVGFAWPAMAQEKAPERITVVRDAETEALLRKFADPLFRAAGPDSPGVRIMLVRDRAINGFASTGNRMFIETGLLGGSPHELARRRPSPPRDRGRP